MQRWFRFRGIKQASTTSIAGWSRRVSAARSVLITGGLGIVRVRLGLVRAAAAGRASWCRGHAGGGDRCHVSRRSRDRARTARPIEVVLGPHDPTKPKCGKRRLECRRVSTRSSSRSSVLGGQPQSKQAERSRGAGPTIPGCSSSSRPTRPTPLGCRPWRRPGARGYPSCWSDSRWPASRPEASDDGLPLASQPSPSAASIKRQTPLVVVAPQPFASSARQLVAAAIRNAKVAELDPGGGAVIADQHRRRSVHPSGPPRSKTPSRPRESPTSRRCGFEAIEAGEKLLKESLKAHPKIVMVFAVDSVSYLGRSEEVDRRRRVSPLRRRMLHQR